MAERPEDNEYLQYVLNQLRRFGPVMPRRLFGGYGLYADDVMFGIVNDDVMYLKIDKQSIHDYIAAGMTAFAPTSKITLKTLYEVPADVLEDTDQLAAWARRAVTAATNSK